MYQANATTACANRICTHAIEGFSDQLIIDFGTQFYSDFESDGVWWGREANSGTRTSSSAIISADGQFLAMPMCITSIPFDNETFFDDCQAVVLERAQ